MPHASSSVLISVCFSSDNLAKTSCKGCSILDRIGYWGWASAVIVSPRTMKSAVPAPYLKTSDSSTAYVFALGTGSGAR